MILDSRANDVNSVFMVMAHHGTGNAWTLVTLIICIIMYPFT